MHAPDYCEAPAGRGTIAACSPLFHVMRRILLSTVLLACSASAAASRLVVSPLDGPADQPVSMRMDGLLPTQAVQLRLSMHDSGGNEWVSQASFRADIEGRVDTASAGAESGSYTGVDAMGLFWSMRPGPGAGQPSPLPFRATDGGLLFEPVPFRLQAFVDGKPVGEQTLLRRINRADVQARPLAVPGIVGNLYFPAGAEHDGRRHPVVITLGGAEGGISTANQYAAWLASNGFIAVAVAYYRMPGLPKDLVRVPIDPVGRTVDWLRKQPFAGRIGVMGGSWGGTVAMAAASFDPRLNAVVSWVGSPAPFRGIRRDVPPADFRAIDLPALRHRGRDLPFLPYSENINWNQPGEHAAALENAMLPIERINGPLLLVAGGDDRLGASGEMAAVAMRRLQRRKVWQPDVLLYYSDAGHLITQSYQPTTFRHDTGPYIPVGGTPAGYARADRESAPAVLAFLRRALVP
ncbi:acyl-CoA thioesterase/bile acid-CoA:amino acid N-acyltransferase family protein [Stenotrophomonas acidaminiphila]|jgi:dienelactone hydrolase|uniref:acyl-CoA thioesterase/bile acid-CoA:amino acid N-acyltransferase family protein n=1 Tax=Stenotrophomonas acidaminiphila TaxID=128780 RepID=UPI0015F9A2E5|nr:acyl-CoA thioesterase/BAAT N-terminal domain-containing protein [Stenotrophomonas acidaminiphila]